MLRNHLKSALRNLSKNKVFSMINIMGLAVGLGAFLLIWQFVRFERSFDNFHELADDIYRVQYEKVYPDSHDKSAGLAAGAGPDIYQEFPEVISFTKMWSASFMSNQLTAKEKVLVPEKIFYADSAFFQMFSFDLLEGDKNTALDAANHLVLSEAMAMNFFGNTDVVGEQVRVNNGYGDELYQVSGVLKKLPANTHFELDVLLSFQTLINASEGSAATTYGWNAFPTYLQLLPGTNQKEIEARLEGFTEVKYAELISQGVQPKLLLRPLQDIYLKSNIRFEVGPTGNERAVEIMSAIALLILFLAYFNYINLSTSKSIDRAKEIGVRKVNGASQGNLIRQFLTESFMLNLVGLILGFTLMQLSIPFFETTLSRPLSAMVVFDKSMVMLFAILLIGGTLLSGFYPAWVLSRTKTIKVLKGQKAVEGSDGMIRKGLVILQFAILCFLLVGSLAVRSQIEFMLNADWGFDSEQMVVIKGPSQSQDGANRFQVFNDAMSGYTGVMGMTNSTSVPGKEISWINNNVRLQTDAPDDFKSIPFLGTNETYLDIMNLKLLAGRNFERDLAGEENAVMLSVAAAKQFGFVDMEEAVNQKIIDGGRERLIVGIVDDYMQGSFKESYQPMIYRYIPLANNYITLKLSQSNLKESLGIIEEQFSSIFPDSSFDYFFLDEFFERQFAQDKIFGNLFNFFTLLGIWISVLGLFGLTSYAVLKRRKEIGIRKVLGASVGSVIGLISKRFIVLTLISLAIALPIAYMAISTWLESYSFATALKAYVFILPVVIILFITVLTTGIISFRSATSNPVDALQYE